MRFDDAPALSHGGRLRAAARRYGIPVGQWLDLSTGLNPRGWPVPAIPEEVWRCLPEDDDDLESIAAAHYGAPHALAVAGTQAAIQALPWMRPPGRVGVIASSYAEHERAWRAAGHDIDAIAPGTSDADAAASRIEAGIDALDTLVLCNPDNPTGRLFPPSRLLAWHERLRSRGGWLVADEAYIDATPEASIAAHAGAEGLIVLRSLGKFYGLAGARVGFVLADATLLERLRRSLGPWAVNGPGRWIAGRALNDRAWQEATRTRLAAESARLDALLRDAGLDTAGGCALFRRVLADDAEALHDALARRSVLTRLFNAPMSLRFGLPAGESDWRRLRATLTEVVSERRKDRR